MLGAEMILEAMKTSHKCGDMRACTKLVRLDAPQ
jgi:hypothetical protein